MNFEKKIALFGGSFNPPHWGHRQVLDYLRGLKDFDEVWMLLSYDHPFEKNLVPFETRAQLCELTVEGLGPRVKVCCFEGELHYQPSYTVDVVRELIKKFPTHKFFLVLGSDCKKDLSKWKDIEILKKMTSFFYIPRSGVETSPFMEISSTFIRNLICQGKNYSKYVTPAVFHFIEKKHLYREHHEKTSS